MDDNAVSVDVKFLNLWPNIGDQLPKRSRKDEAIPQNLPGLLETALTALYGSYEKSFAQWKGSQAAADGEPPPVFIVVCNNTTVSKMVYEYIAGWTKSSARRAIRSPSRAGSGCSRTWTARSVASAAPYDPGRLAPAGVR